MRLRLIPAAAGLLWCATTLPAYGVPCYQVWNNQDVLVYQSPLPPFDLSAPAFDRSMSNLRARRGQLIFFDTTNCAIITIVLAGPGQASPDPASLLVDVRGGGGAGVPRSGMLAPVPASGGAAPAPSGGAPMNAGTPAKSPGRY